MIFLCEMIRQDFLKFRVEYWIQIFSLNRQSIDTESNVLVSGEMFSLR